MMVLFSKFRLSEVKIKGVFVELNIKKLIANILFAKTMCEKKEVWELFKDIMLKFLGNRKYASYKNIIKYCRIC